MKVDWIDLLGMFVFFLLGVAVMLMIFRILGVF